MKYSILSAIAFIFFIAPITAQDFEAPKDGAKIYTEKSTVEIKNNGESLFDLWIVRSNRAKRTNFQMPKITSVEGLEFFFKVDPDNKDHYTVNIKATAAQLGSFSATITSRSNGIQLVTGKIININVLPATSVASSDGE